jgi:hypothetical protein
MALETEPRDWKVLAEQASKEMDGKKLSELVKGLCAALDGGTSTGKSLRPTPKTDVAADRMLK